MEARVCAQCWASLPQIPNVVVNKIVGWRKRRCSPSASQWRPGKRRARKGACWVPGAPHFPTFVMQNIREGSTRQRYSPPFRNARWRTAMNPLVLPASAFCCTSSCAWHIRQFWAETAPRAANACVPDNAPELEYFARAVRGHTHRPCRGPSGAAMKSPMCARYILHRTTFARRYVRQLWAGNAPPRPDARRSNKQCFTCARSRQFTILCHTTPSSTKVSSLLARLDRPIVGRLKLGTWSELIAGALTGNVITNDVASSCGIVAA